MLEASIPIWEAAMAKETRAAVQSGEAEGRAQHVQFIPVSPEEQKRFDELYDEDALARRAGFEPNRYRAAPRYFATRGKSRTGSRQTGSRDLRQGEPMQPLEGIRIADFTHIMAGPYATHLLRLLGAEVIKVESPGRGDAMRNYGSDRAYDGMAPAFIAVNAGKKSMSLDLKNAGLARGRAPTHRALRRGRREFSPRRHGAARSWDMRRRER